MIALAVLVASLTLSPLEAGPETPRCSKATLYVGPSPELRYVHAVATGNRIAVEVDERALWWNESLPDSAAAFELRVVEAVGGPSPLAPGDLILVTPWSYAGDCSWRAWDGPWVEAGEETVLTLSELWTQGDASRFHVLGRLSAYPQGLIAGPRDAAEEWMTPGQYFELLASLPPPERPGSVNLREANARAREHIRNGPPFWSTTYPGTMILRSGG